MEYVVELLNITKEFPGIKANDNVTLQLKKGEIHALLGENGAGKSTLMSVLFGLYQPEEGKIKVNGQEVVIDNPNVANDLKIGMVHQHFKLVHNFTVTENIVLGDEPKLKFGRINIDDAAKRVKELSEQYNLKVDPHSKIEDITVGMQQRVEILKMLYRDAEVLIFDEPTAVLTPQEIDELMNIMHDFANEGKSIIVITHKLKEIKKVADRCTILRKGKYIDTVDVKTTSEQELAEKMVGRHVSFEVNKKEQEVGQSVVSLKDVKVYGENEKLKLNVDSLDIKEGEILGIAGIEGNGQTDLINVISGLTYADEGAITFNGQDITKLPIRKRVEAGMGHIPEDRHRHGLVLDFSLEDNYILKTYYKEPFSSNGLLNHEPIRENSEKLTERFDVRSGQGSETITRSMSGGNQQKAIIAREISRDPNFLIAAQPTRGLDVGAIEYIHDEIIRVRDTGGAVLLVSLELDEVLNVADRIAVIYEGEIVKVVNAKETDQNEIGIFMSGGKSNG
ncbi:ABC transporter ATP-binding protein [Haloplasma contractile]|uniref:Sugar ABC transporter ATP-binding protein n=1 Tax=Haloplasma contractile SSD-17B TaxID=1033810 RepID=U2DZT2_9MOLU|nr:ABC transporter ATP-binding protein [Haloplasma contractile]ERJ13697.1 Sugar ABC transporter ATP-binding protein [Haloplasma contractile SSD-17B]